MIKHPEFKPNSGPQRFKARALSEDILRAATEGFPDVNLIGVRNRCKMFKGYVNIWSLSGGETGEARSISSFSHSVHQRMGDSIKGSS